MSTEQIQNHLEQFDAAKVHNSLRTFSDSNQNKISHKRRLSLLRDSHQLLQNEKEGLKMIKAKQERNDKIL